MEKTISSPKIYFRGLILMILFNLLHLLAWDLTIAFRLNMNFNIIMSCLVAVISTTSIVLISLKKNAGIYLAIIPALWAILSWVSVLIQKGFVDPNGVWWYPIFTVLQGILIFHFILITLKNNVPNKATTSLEELNFNRKIVIVLLTLQIGQKFVRELVVAIREFGNNAGVILGSLPTMTIVLLTITGIVLLYRQHKFGAYISLICGSILIFQPVIYHLILSKSCLGNIWWYPFFTLTQGVFIVYFSIICLRRTV